MALALSACVTSRPAVSYPCGITWQLEGLIAAQKKFSAEAGQAYVVIATDALLPDGKTETFTFQRADLASSTFLPEYVKVTFSSRADVGDNFQRPMSMAATSMRFAGSRAAPGDYALVSVSNRNTGGSFHCYSEAPLYRFREGVINLVRQEDPADAAASVCRAAVAAQSRDPETLQAQVTDVLTNYPEMQAPLVVAPLLGTAKCDPGKGWLPGSPCTANDKFSLAALSLP